MRKTMGQILAGALQRVESSAKNGVVKSSEISRRDRELLVKAGYLKEILMGWYLLAVPTAKKGESTLWFGAFWDFIGLYLEDRLANDYCLSAESSMDAHLGTTIIPSQVVINTSKPIRAVVKFPFETSALIYTKNLPANRELVRGVQVMSLADALCQIAPAFFENRPRDAEISLRSVRTIADVSRALIAGRYLSAAGRIAGAYEFLNETAKAQQILEETRAAGLKVTPVNPFQTAKPFLAARSQPISPHVGRIEVLWASMRDDVIAIFPPSSGTPPDRAKYLEQVDEVYQTDAYNSLSIEGYKVTPELIEKIRDGKWNPDGNPDDQQQIDAMAAKGYLEAFKTVKSSIRSIFDGQQPDVVVRRDLQKWYRALFSPSVDAGLLQPYHLAGYRNAPVYINGSRHVPPSSTAVVDTMEALFELFHQESNAAVRAVLGHFIFVYIHPYRDGNGRIGRFLMNTMLAAGGYPWTVIRVSRKDEYLQALETASVGGDIRRFAKFIVDEMEISSKAAAGTTTGTA